MMGEIFLIPLLILGLLIAVYIILYLAGYRMKLIKNHPQRATTSVERPSGFNLEGIERDVLIRAASTVSSRIEEGILLLGENNEVKYMNQAARNIFDFSSAAGVSVTFIQVVRDYEFENLLKKCKASGREESAFIETQKRKYFLKVIIFPRQEESGYVVLVQDLTERRRLDNIRHDFISNISHELRTPISSIKLLAETLGNGALRDKDVAIDFLKKIIFEVDKLTQMVNELNQLASLDSDSLSTVDKGATDVTALIVETVERLKPQADRAGIAIDVSIEQGLPTPVLDKGRIGQVLMNLIHNAIKFTGSGGSIKIGASRENDAILVSVADSGIGIPADDLPRVFERFYKVDKSRSSDGSGLGLAISKHIVNAHGGRIWAQSQEGKGSTFYFTLPLF